SIGSRRMLIGHSSASRRWAADQAIPLDTRTHRLFREVDSLASSLTHLIPAGPVRAGRGPFLLNFGCEMSSSRAETYLTIAQITPKQQPSLVSVSPHGF